MSGEFEFIAVLAVVTLAASALPPVVYLLRQRSRRAQGPRRRQPQPGCPPADRCGLPEQLPGFDAVWNRYSAAFEAAMVSHPSRGMPLRRAVPDPVAEQHKRNVAEMPEIDGGNKS